MSDGKMGFSGSLTTKKIGAKVPHLYRLRNSFGRLFKPDGHITVRSELTGVLFPSDGGRPVNLGLLSTRVVTNAGVAYLAANFIGTNAPNAFNFHDCGTGTNAESVSDTALQTPYGGARATGTQSNPSAPVYRTVGTISFTSTLAITEHGVFSASSSGTLWDRSVFSAINVVSGDSIQFTYNLTINAGG
jgi:hypothetical protein